MAAEELKLKYTDEQAMLADSAWGFLRERCTSDKVREWMDLSTGYDTTLWQEMADLGWLGIALPEEHGGSCLPAGALVSVVEPMGRYLLATPFLATTLAGQLLLGTASKAQCREWLPAIAKGECIATLALSDAGGSWVPEHIDVKASRMKKGWRLEGKASGVLELAYADLVLVPARTDQGLAVFAVSREDLSYTAIEREQLVDETRRSYRLDCDGIQLDDSARLGKGDATAAIHDAHALAWLLVGSELTGVADGAFSLMLDYLKTRKQFGKTIGSYQALKHPAVEIMAQIEDSRGLMQYAASVFEGDKGESAVAARMLKAYAGETAAYATDRAVQFHGAFGFTWECDVQLYFRRATWARHVFGDALHHRARLADLLLD